MWFPVTAKDVAKETNRDQTLSRVKEFIEKGWQIEVNEEMKLFKAKEAELAIEKGCILWGMRAVIPKNLQEKILSEIHSGHQGIIISMKQVARSYVCGRTLTKILSRALSSVMDAQRRGQSHLNRNFILGSIQVILGKDFISISQDQSTTKLTL